ncbi:hypothetical protein QC761_0054900 [Podospora bellae-mahoneyi]|uniref:3'-5' exonuclease domain-containing protein n=1 Tax=Podospora bellae-mahoneyi TaxID=2093777 RepID=A0ABR0FPF8_9PEZI|nr:hypothetical protein QC761_0054900 [Podospora bellae-mahoneyi]
MASPSPSTTPNPSLVTNVQALRNFLATIGPSSSIYVDLEGTNLGRGGTLDLITVLVPPDRKVRIIDVKAMGNQAFTTPSKKDDNVTLKSILEDPSIRKYLWDVRNDADALKSLYHVAISGVIDLQLLENLTRQGNSFYVTGLDKAVENDLRLDWQEQIEWKKTKEDIRKRMASGDSGIFSTRPFTTPKYHSIHAQGGTVDDLPAPEEKKTSGSAKAETNGHAAPITAEEGEVDESVPMDESDETSHPAISDAQHSADANKVGGGLSGGQPAVPLGPGPGPQVLLGSVQDEELKKLLMSWYYAGYYTGLYEGKQQGLKQAQQQDKSS